jgi:hypothetical protein
MQGDLFAAPVSATVDVYLLATDHSVDPKIGPLWPAGFYAVMPDGTVYRCADLTWPRVFADWKCGRDAVVTYHGTAPLSKILGRK